LDAPPDVVAGFCTGPAGAGEGVKLGCGTLELFVELALRVGAAAVRAVGFGFSTMRIGSRSPASATMLGLVVEASGVGSAEIDARLLALGEVLLGGAAIAPGLGG